MLAAGTTTLTSLVFLSTVLSCVISKSSVVDSGSGGSCSGSASTRCLVAALTKGGSVTGVGGVGGDEVLLKKILITSSGSSVCGPGEV